MPGFILNVQGLTVFLNGFEGRNEAAHRDFLGVAENLISDLERADDLPGEVRCRMDTKANSLALFIVHDAMPFFSRHAEWHPIDSRTYRKEVLTAISESTP